MFLLILYVNYLCIYIYIIYYIHYMGWLGIHFPETTHMHFRRQPEEGDQCHQLLHRPPEGQQLAQNAGAVSAAIRGIP